MQPEDAASPIATILRVIPDKRPRSNEQRGLAQRIKSNTRCPRLTRSDDFAGIGSPCERGACRGGPAINRFVIISGCSSGGKSTLLDELGRRGYAIVEEPGRRIVREEMLADGAALPSVDPIAFARRAVALALADRREARRRRGWVFFDRGLIDASVALQHWSGEPALARVKRSHRYHQRIFLAPPWPEIYVTDSERQHGFDVAVAEYRRLVASYAALGYEATVLPKIGVAERAELVLRTLEGSCNELSGDPGC